MSDFEVVTKTKVGRERISDLLCNAFEGGSNYWADSVRVIESGNSELAGRELNYVSDHLAYGATISIKDDEAESTYMIGEAQIQSGLDRMAEDYTHHWIDFLNENDDATTGDAFLQCCVFGEVIYG